MMEILTLFAAVIAGTLAWMVPVYCRAVLRNARMYEQYANAFYKAASPLMQDSETPAGILDFLEFYNERITDRSVAFRMLKTVGIGRFLERDEFTPRRIAEIHSFLNRRHELKEPYFSAIVNGFLAISYNGGLITGFLLRAWMAGGSSADDETLAGADPRSEIVAARFIQASHAA